jgi:AcrR family transcriptional regulator
VEGVSSSSYVTGPPTSNGSRRDEIIDVAAHQFALLGFHGVSMRDIAKAHNSSVAALYNHFDGKDDLLLAVGRRFFSVFIEHLEESAAQPGDGLSRVIAMLDTCYMDGCTYRNEFISISRDNRHIALTPGLAPLVAARNVCVAIWDRVLQDGMQDGSIRPGLDTAGVIWIVFCAMSGMLDDNRAAEFASTVTDDPLQCLTQLLTEGLRARP